MRLIETEGFRPALSALSIVLRLAAVLRSGECVAIQHVVEGTESWRLSVNPWRNAANIRRLRSDAREGIHLEAVLCHRGRIERTIISDISRYGAGIQGNHAVKPGELVTIQVVNGRQFEARVRWKTQDRCGLELLQPLQSLKDLNAIIDTSLTAPPAAAPPVVELPGKFGFVGQSTAMKTVYQRIARAAASNASVFITGENGSGKEVCAEAIHRASNRRDRPFIAVNCAAIPRDLFESEMFGHVRGSFTGATADRQGAALEAQDGTLFLDEIGELDLAFQSKLLRFLQTRMVKSLGDDRSRPCKARILCATNRDPRLDVAAGRLREDLFYRLHVIPIELPSLRVRGDDIGLLAAHFVRLYSEEAGGPVRTLTSDAQARLMQHDWPGNVRELQNVVRCAVEFSDGGDIGADMIDEFIQASSPRGTPSLSPKPAAVSRPSDSPVLALDVVIQQAIDNAIRCCDGSIPRAANELGVSPSTIYRHIQARKDKSAG